MSSRVTAAPLDQLALTVITVEEMLSGWHRLLRRAKTDVQVASAYNAMASAVQLMSSFEIHTYSENAIARYRFLLSKRLNVSGNDLRIAAIALEHGATVVTRNVRDFGRIPDLLVENWCD